MFKVYNPTGLLYTAVARSMNFAVLEKISAVPMCPYHVPTLAHLGARQNEVCPVRKQRYVSRIGPWRHLVMVRRWSIIACTVALNRCRQSASSRTTWVRHRKGKINLDSNEAGHDGVTVAPVGPCMQIICISLQTDNHTSTSSLNFLQAGCSS